MIVLQIRWYLTWEVGSTEYGLTRQGFKRRAHELCNAAFDKRSCFRVTLRSFFSLNHHTWARQLFLLSALRGFQFFHLGSKTDIKSVGVLIQ